MHVKRVMLPSKRLTKQRVNVLRQPEIAVRVHDDFRLRHRGSLLLYKRIKVGACVHRIHAEDAGDAAGAGPLLPHITGKGLEESGPELFLRHPHELVGTGGGNCQRGRHLERETAG